MNYPAKSRGSKNKKLYTYGDYLTWPDDERWEIIDGVPYAMTPGPTVTHQDVLGNFFIKLSHFFADMPCRVFVAPLDVRFPQENEADEKIKTVVQPDILVVCDKIKIDDRGIRGAPDWAIEIVSSSTASRDYIKKLRLYERHGVREYWIIHPYDRNVIVFKLNKDGLYDEPATFSLEKPDQRIVKSHLFPALVLNLEDLFKVKEI